MLDFIQDFVSGFLDLMEEVLPTSPFQPHIQSFADLPYLNYVNWFLPVNAILNICAGWLVSIGLFYTYSILLRWIRAIN